MTEPLVTIIVPVYNAERYLRETLESVRAQTFADWVCLCVDDGSSDASARMLDEMAAVDSRFQVIHQKNAGPAAARNQGLDAVRTPWFLFMDADDKFHPRAIESMMAQVGDEVDVVTASYTDEEARLSSEGPARLVVDPVRRLCEDRSWRGMPWGRLMRTERFRDVRFVLRYHEDVGWLTAAMQKARREIVFEAPLYWYRPTPGSFSRRPDYEAALPELWRYQASVCPALRPRLGEIVYSWLVKHHDDAQGRLLVRQLLAENVVSFARLPFSRRMRLWLRGIRKGGVSR